MSFSEISLAKQCSDEYSQNIWSLNKENSSNFNTLFEQNKSKIYYNILEYEKIIGEHFLNLKDSSKKRGSETIAKKNIFKKRTAEFIIQINNYFISIGTNKVLNLYNESYKEINRIKKKLSDWVYNICEVQNNKSVSIIVCSKNNISSIISKNLENINLITNEMKYLYLLKVNDNDYYYCTEKSVYYFRNLLSDYNGRQYKYQIFKNELMKSAIKIKDNLIVFKSNKVASKGKDELIFYNCKSDLKLSVDIKENFSFIFSSNGLMVMPSDSKINEYNYKLLFCACKKYIKDQKNGILLVNIIDKNNNKNQNNFEFKYIFYDTGNFEVYCFCPLSIIKEKNILEKIELIETNYFLVGGFIKDKNQGAIKLYKIIYNNKNYSKIEYIEDIFFGNNKNAEDNYLNNEKIKSSKIFIKEPISSIIQSNIDGKILITSWDGNVYLFDYSNIDDYLTFDEQFNNIQAKNFFR